MVVFYLVRASLLRSGVAMGVAGRWFRVSTAVVGCCLAGCTASLSGGPQRVFTAKENLSAARTTLADIERRYHRICDSAQLPSVCNPQPDLVERQSLRNEYIGESMQAIDAQYAAYEEGLTRDRQLVGFGAATTALSLNTAGTLAPGSAPLFNGLAGLATGIQGKTRARSCSPRRSTSSKDRCRQAGLRLALRS